MPRVVHFEIHASTPQRLIEFYTALFGWQFRRWTGAEDLVISTGRPGEPGIDGGLVQRRGERAAPGQGVNAFVCTVQVDALDATLQQAIALGGALAVPRMPIPGVGWLAYAKDPDGNLLGLMQPDPSAGDGAAPGS